MDCLGNERKRYVLVIDLRCLLHVGVMMFGRVNEKVADSRFFGVILFSVCMKEKNWQVDVCVYFFLVGFLFLFVLICFFFSEDASVNVQ